MLISEVRLNRKAVTGNLHFKKYLPLRLLANEKVFSFLILVRRRDVDRNTVPRSGSCHVELAELESISCVG